MKKKWIALIICLCFLYPWKAFAMKNPYYDLGYNDCTWTAWQIAHDRLGVELPAWGYADNWYEYAARDGYPVGQVAMPGSIVCWKGHVGYVYSVSGNEMYVLEGGQYTDTGYGEYWHTCNGPSGSGKAFMGYIYLAGLPGDEEAVEEVTPKTEPQKESTEGVDSGKAEPVSEKVVPIERQSSAQPSETEESRVGSDQKAVEERLARLAEMRHQKEALSKDISFTKSEIDRLTHELEERKDRMSVGVRVYYEYGTESYLQVLFSAEDFTDFLTRFEYLSKIIRAENQAMSEARSTLKSLQEKELTLQEQQAALDTLIG